MNSKYSLSAMKSVNSGFTADDSDSDDVELITEIALEPWVEPAPYEPDRKNFNLNNAWCAIFNLPTCCEVMLSPEMQQRLNIIVGKNVTQEYPWRHVPFSSLREIVLSELPHNEKMLAELKNFNPKNPVLMGYVPTLTQHLETPQASDPFIFFISPTDTKNAMTIIKNIETYENWLYRKPWLKRGRRWAGFGSEGEVDLVVETRYDPTDSIEVQSVYPVRHTGARRLSFRLSENVRDGLVELFPNENIKYDLVNRKRMPLGVQVLPFYYHKAIQTKHEFPTRAYTQYSTVQDIDDATIDKSDSEEERERGITREREGPKPPVQLSRQIKRLLSALEFSTVNFYRDDYGTLVEKHIQQYMEPHLEEAICFANISKTNHRFICAIDWYPRRAGLLVTSYVFSTVASLEAANSRVDTVQRAVLRPNPVLLWSFSDNLSYKMEFQSPQEVTSVAFCPYDSNLLIGGMKNGQVCIWDLQGRIRQMDHEEFLTAAQSRYRHIMREYLKDTIFVNEDYTVPISTISSLDDSHKAAVTGIYWLGRQWYVNAYGKFYEDRDKSARHKCFITCGMDGTIFFWDLDKLMPRKGDEGHNKVLPKSLSQSESKFKRLVMKAVFMIGFKEPITALIGDTITIRYFQKKSDAEEAIENGIVNSPVTPWLMIPRKMQQTVISASMYGHLEGLSWAGTYTEADTVNKLASSLSFARVHDGPVLCTKKSPFIPHIFLSVGRTVFAIWRDDYHYSPILWRKRSNDLTSATWSMDRPSVFFLTRIDGSIEVWDIIARDDNACLDSILGGGMLTGIIEHGPEFPDKLLGVGDYNSSFRMVKLPSSYYKPLHNELNRFEQFIGKEVTRKRFIQTWEEKFFEDNKELIQAKRVAEAESRKEIERLEKENEAIQRLSKTEQDQLPLPPQAVPYGERMARAWEELNIKRLMNVLMSRLQMDSERLKNETVLWKKLLAYEEAKKKAHEEIVKRIDKVVTNLRLCLLPEEVVDTTHIELINNMVLNLLKTCCFYDEGAEESRQYIGLFGSIESFDFIDFLERGVQRRRLMNKILGSSTERCHWYEVRKQADRLDESIWGHQFYTHDYERLDEEEGMTVPGHGADALSQYYLDDDSPTPTSIVDNIDINDDEEENEELEQYDQDLLEYADPVKQIGPQ